METRLRPITQEEWERDEKATRDWFSSLPSIEDALARQSPTIDGWICPKCVHHQGGLSCELNIFIAFVGANLLNCWGFKEGKVCRHCSKVT